MVFARSQKHPIRQEISLVNFNRPKKNVRIISRPPWFCEICQMALTFGPYKQIRAIVDGLGVMNLARMAPKTESVPLWPPQTVHQAILLLKSSTPSQICTIETSWVLLIDCMKVSVAKSSKVRFFFFFANSRTNFHQNVLIFCKLPRQFSTKRTHKYGPYPMIKQTLAPPKCSLGGF